TLIRFTDVLLFFDLEGTDKCRLNFKTRGRNEMPTMLEGTTDDVIDRALVIVGAGLPRNLREEFEREMRLFSFPTFEEYLNKFDDALEEYSVLVWRERYERSRVSFLEFGDSPPDMSRVMPFNSARYGRYAGYTIQDASNLGRLDYAGDAFF